VKASAIMDNQSLCFRQHDSEKKNRNIHSVQQKKTDNRAVCFRRVSRTATCQDMIAFGELCEIVFQVGLSRGVHPPQRQEVTFPSFPYPPIIRSRSSPLTSPPVLFPRVKFIPCLPLEVGPLNPARGFGGGALHFSFKVWHLVATILMIFPRINLPNFAQFKQYYGKSVPRVLLLKAKFFTI